MIMILYTWDILITGGTMPMAVCTFLEKYDFTGKIIKPFCTHEGSGMGSSEEDIKKIIPDSVIKKGGRYNGSFE